MAAANYSGVGSEYYSINFQDTTPRLTIELKMQAQMIQDGSNVVIPGCEKTVPELHEKKTITDQFCWQTCPPVPRVNHCYNTSVIRPYRSRSGIEVNPYKLSKKENRRIQAQTLCSCKIIRSCSQEENRVIVLSDKDRLYRAVRYNNTETAEALLKSGVSPNCCDKFKRTPLHLAASYCYVDMVRLLLRFKADPNAKDSIGNTPLHLAAVTDNDTVISLLMEAGTDLTKKNSIGQTMMELAIAKLKILQRSRGVVNPELLEQVSQSIQMMRDRMNRKVTVNPDVLGQLFSAMSVNDSTDEDIQGLLNKLSIS